MAIFAGSFQRFFYTSVGKIIISILLGLGIATLFRKVCRDKNCIEFRGPAITSVEGKIFQYDDECFTYHSRASTCSADKKTIQMHPEIAAQVATGGLTGMGVSPLSASFASGSGGNVDHVTPAVKEPIAMSIGSQASANAAAQSVFDASGNTATVFGNVKGDTFGEKVANYVSTMATGK